VQKCPPVSFRSHFPGAISFLRVPDHPGTAGVLRDDVAETTGHGGHTSQQIETSSSRLPGAAVIFPISPYMSPPGCPKARETPPMEVMVAPAARKSRRRVLTPSFYGSRNLFSNIRTRKVLSSRQYLLERQMCVATLTLTETPRPLIGFLSGQCLGSRTINAHSTAHPRRGPLRPPSRARCHFTVRIRRGSRRPSRVCRGISVAKVGSDQAPELTNVRHSA